MESITKLFKWVLVGNKTRTSIVLTRSEFDGIVLRIYGCNRCKSIFKCQRSSKANGHYPFLSLCIPAGSNNNALEHTIVGLNKCWMIQILSMKWVQSKEKLQFIGVLLMLQQFKSNVWYNHLVIFIFFTQIDRFYVKIEVRIGWSRKKKRKLIPATQPID